MRPVEEGGLGWSLGGLVDEQLPQRRPFAYERLLQIRGTHATSGEELEAGLRGLNRRVRLPDSTGALTDPDLEVFLKQMRDLAVGMPVYMLRTDRQIDYCEAAIRLVRHKGRAIVRGGSTAGDAEQRMIWERALKVGAKHVQDIAPLVFLADSACAAGDPDAEVFKVLPDAGARTDEPAVGASPDATDSTDPDAHEDSRTIFAASPEDVVRLRGLLRKRSLVNPTAGQRFEPEDLDHFPGDAIDTVLNGFYLLLGEVVYATVREGRSRLHPTSAERVLAHLFDDPALPVTTRLEYLSSLVGTAAIAELDSKPDQDGLARARTLLGEPSNAAETFAGVAHLARPDWDATELARAWHHEASRLWLAVDAHPHLRKSKETAKLARHLEDTWKRSHSTLFPGPERNGIVSRVGAASALVHELLAARRPGEVAQESDEVLTYILDFVRTSLERAETRINSLDVIPFHVLDEPVGRSGTPLNAMDRRLTSPDKADRGEAQDWFEAFSALRRSQAFEMLPLKVQERISDSILKPRGLTETSSKWREMLGEVPPYTRIPMKEAIEELGKLITDMESALKRGAEVSPEDHAALLGLSRKLLDLQLWMGPPTRRAIPPAEPVDEEAKAEIYWQLLLKEVQDQAEITIDLTARGYQVAKGGSGIQRRITMVPHPVGELTMVLDAHGRSPARRVVIPLIGLRPGQLLKAMEHLGTPPE